MMFATTNSYATGPQAGITLLNNGNVTIRGTVGASNFSGSSSGTNTGDQTLPTLSSLGAAAAATTLAGYGITNAIQKGADITSGASWTTATKFNSTGNLSQAAGNHALSVNSANGNDAFMSFHIASDYAIHFGLDGATNRMHVGGWSDGTGTQYQLYDSRDFSVASVLNSNVTLATLGYTGATNANYITNNNQLTNGAGYTTNIGTLTNSNDRNYITDTRSASRAPSYYDDRYAQWDFSQSSNFAVSGGDTWASTLTVSKWSSWHVSHRQEQLIFAGTKLARRVATSDTAWSSTYDIIDTSGIDNVKAGYIQSSASLRAPIFYDSNDTGFYLDPASQSRLGSLKLDGIISGAASGCAEYGRNHAYHTPEIKGYGAEFMIGAQHTEININYRTCNNGASGHTPTTWRWRAGASSNWSDHYMGLIQSSSSMRAPIFYDSNDTNYYIDSNSTSYVKYLGRKEHQSGHFVGSYNNIGGNSAKSNPIYTIGSSYNPNETTLADMYGIGYAHPNLWGSGKTSDWGLYIANNGSVDATIGDGSVTAWFASQVHAAGDFRAPIFYDLNDTGYYLNPNSTSILSLVNHQVGVGVNQTGSHDILHMESLLMVRILAVYQLMV